MSSTYLLINPEAIASQSYYDVFRVVRQVKVNNKPGFVFDSLIQQNLPVLYKGGNPGVISAIKALDSSQIKNEIGRHGKLHAKQKSGISFDNYMKRVTPRLFLDLFTNLAAISNEVKVYHRVKSVETGNYKIAPCSFSPARIKLLFKVNDLGTHGLAIEPLVETGIQQLPLSEFKVSSFLLEKEGVYYLLSIKDRQTLDWLENANPSQYCLQPDQFADKIVSVLERDYEVQKEEAFTINHIESLPQNAVYLSEISDTFLMFTPRWNYEGFIVEDTDQQVVEEIRQGQIYRIKRNAEAETAFVEKLRAFHPNFEKQRNGQFYLSFDEARRKNWFLKVYQQLLGEEVQIVGMDMLSHFRYSPHSIETQMTIARTIGADLHLNIKVSFGDEKIEPSAIQRTLFNGQKFVLLKDNSIGIITDEWYERYGIIFKHGRIQKGELIVPQWILLGIEEKYQSKEMRPAIEKNWWGLWQQWQTAEEPVFAPPPNLQATMRPYQQKGFEWLVLLSKIRAGACLADDMGLGKTLQTIAFLQHVVNEKPSGKHLIVAPLSLVFNWKQELEKFAPHLGVYVFHQANRSLKDFAESGAQVMITSYGTVRSAIDDISLLEWETVVVDESHNIKNPSAQITRAVYRLSAANRIALSGTPVMNNTFDIFSQMNFLAPGLLGGPEFFKREYANPIDRDQNEEKTKALQKVTAPFVLRRTKKQVAADLPAKTEAVLWCQMDTAQREAYENIRGQIKANVFLDIERDGITKAKFSILQGILKLRQVCCSPALLKEEEITTDESAKLDVLMDELRDNVGSSKSLVFSQYLGMLEMVAQRCRKLKIPYLYFDGSTPLHERERMVKTFQDEGSPERVFLISLKAGNAGLNLTAAEYVFLLDPWWNNAVEQQAIDRTHRIGQLRNIFAYKLVCRDTIEEKILNLQLKKKQLSEGLVTEEEGFVKNLSEEDIHFLFD